ncbi:unnamed protein product [Pleuronectes platessa]|uniref:Lipoxygenase domain-containing protein n=1 Tax=Pleuronectes platessa TaxID=8262 RepID=A0A9N7UI89_PLEPL|nr:unnamed protein product [Pleuronectes platessa]
MALAGRPAWRELKQSMREMNQNLRHLLIEKGKYSPDVVQHFDYFFWTPNSTLLLHKPPPTTEGHSSMETIMETIPNIPLGQYPEKRFDEPELTQVILEFQAELSYLGGEIVKRNSQLELPNDYLLPSRIENSVSI